MKLRLKIILSVLLGCMVFSGVGFNALSIDKVEALSTSAKSMCVLEQNSRRVLEQKDMNTMRPNASTTKIVTAITVIQNCDNLDEIITVNNKSIGIEGTSIYLRKDENISVRDLLYGLMLRSGNDSAVALAYHVGGSCEKFVDMMNELCIKAGANNTHFANPHGLDDENHYTTAYDLALVTAYALNNPIFAEIVSIDLDVGHGIAGQRAEHDSAKRVAEGDAKSSLKRLYDKLTAGAVLTQINRRYIGLFNLNHSK